MSPLKQSLLWLVAEEKTTVKDKDLTCFKDGGAMRQGPEQRGTSHDLLVDSQ